MEAAYRVLAEQASELVARHAPDSTFRYASAGASALLGFSPEELLGTSALARIDPADREHARSVLSSLTSGSRARLSFSARFLRKNGSSVWLDISAYPVRSERDQSVEGYVTIAREALFDNGAIHELRALMQRVAQLTTLVDAVPGMVYQWTARPDGSREFTFCNRWPRDALGIDIEQLGTLDMELVKYAHPDDSKLAWELWERAKQKREPWTWRGRFCPPSGLPLHVVGHATPVEQDDGSVLWSGVLLDDTERALGDELQHAREAAEAGSRAKSVFLANMSHEIRTPMNAIIGLSHLALEADPAPCQREYLTQIRAAGVTLLDIINDVLDVSKIEAGKVELEHEPFQIDRTLDAVANVISVRAADLSIEIVFAVDPRVPEELVGDRMRLGQVLMNLAGNAVKFTTAGEIVVAVELLERLEGAVRLRFSVRDTGIGMSLEQQRNVFQPFTQVDDSASRKYSGTGLGLSIAQELVQLMGGTIKVESAPGQGSEFSFDITLGIGSGALAQRPLSADLPALRVLVVDPSQVARDVLTRSLLAMGFMVCAVEGADEALSTLRQAAQRGTPYQLALVDVRSQNSDGIELCARIASDASVASRPALVLISTQAREEIELLYKLPVARAYLRKPISRSTLLDTIKEAQQAAPVPPAAAAPALRERKQPPLSGLTLLVVEDNEINQILARDLLESAGAVVVLAGEGQEAIRLANARTPGFDAILMDVQMPSMDGHATTRMMRSEPKTAHTPIIAMTAHAFDAERSKCLASGMNAHVSKPISPRELVQTVLTWSRPELAVENKPVVAERPRPALAASGNPSFDSSALSIVFKDKARQLAFLRKFVDSARHALSELDGFFQAKDAAQIGFVGHKLKSSAKACGAHALSTTFAELESEAKAPDWRELERLAEKASALLTEVSEHVETRERMLKE